MVNGFPMGPSKNIFNFHPEAQELQLWDVDIFLKMTGYGPAHFNDESVKFWMKKIKNKEPIDVPFIDKDLERGFAPVWKNGVLWYPNHEGRHRALAAQSLGIEKIPVVVYDNYKGYCVPVGFDIEKDKNMFERPQRSGIRNVPTGVDVKKVVTEWRNKG